MWTTAAFVLHLARSAAARVTRWPEPSLERAETKVSRALRDLDLSPRAEPTDLPEGEVVYLQLVDGLVSPDDDMDPEERAALHEELEASLAEADAGQTEDFSKVILELRTRL